MTISKINKTHLSLLILILFSACTLFYNLGDRLLWGDEAETALLGINITKFGLPKVFDGKNYITFAGIAHVTNQEDIWIWRPWLDQYLAAASFAVFGKNTTAARLPFVFIAFLSVMFLAYIVQKIYRNKVLTLFATLLLVTNVEFILHARQCRYYSLIVFAQISLIYALYQLFTGKEKYSKYGIVLLSLSLIVQFYSNYMIVLPNLLSLTVCTLAVYRKHPFLIRNELIGLTIFSLFVIPWLLYAQPWHQTGYLGFGSFGTNLLSLITRMNFYLAPVVLLFIPIAMYFKRQGRQTKNSINHTERSIKIFLWTLIPSYLFVLSIIPDQFLRYMIPLIPAVVILLSKIIVDYIKPIIFQFILITLIAFSNLISVLSSFPPTLNAIEMPIVKLIREITSNYHNKLEDVVQFLKTNAHPEESILVADTEFPIIFYTNMRIIDARRMPPDENNLPDWIFLESATSYIDRPALQIPLKYRNQYELISLKVHDSPRLDNCPDPIFHISFSDDKFTKFLIYRKINHNKNTEP